MLLRCDPSNGFSQSTKTDLEASSLVKIKDQMISFCESNEVENVRGCEDLAWKVINKYIEHNETNGQLWCITTELGSEKGRV